MTEKQLKKRLQDVYNQFKGTIFTVLLALSQGLLVTSIVLGYFSYNELYWGFIGLGAWVVANICTITKLVRAQRRIIEATSQ